MNNQYNRYIFLLLFIIKKIFFFNIKATLLMFTWPAWKRKKIRKHYAKNGSFSILARQIKRTVFQYRQWSLSLENPQISWRILYLFCLHKWTQNPYNKESVGMKDATCIDRKRNASHWELNQLWPYKDTLCVRRWSDAGPAGRVRCRKRFKSITKTIHFAHLGILCPSRYIIYLHFVMMQFCL